MILKNVLQASRRFEKNFFGRMIIWNYKQSFFLAEIAWSFVFLETFFEDSVRLRCVLHVTLKFQKVRQTQ